MDFVEGFPKVGGKSVILTLVDRFSKYAHFIPLSHPYSASSVAKAFFDEIVRLHGFLVRLSVTEIPFSLVIFGRSFSGSLVSLFFSVPRSTHKRTGSPR
jgi:hypothetical protein